LPSISRRGLFRRIVEVHKLDRLALDEAEAAINPQARAALAHIDQHVADGRCDYLVLQLPTGDMTLEEARGSLQLFIDEVMPGFV
jgi:hypothetical protein